MKNEIRHEMNEGAQATIKAIRGIITRLRRQDDIDELSADALRGAITAHVKLCSKRKGGLGRK